MKRIPSLPPWLASNRRRPGIARRAAAGPATGPTLICGVLVSPAELPEIQSRLPLAIMIDNLATARPQVGLVKADLVFEAVAEGGITRFLAVFWRNKPGRIMPVRSARVYYMDWAAELDALY